GMIVGETPKPGDMDINICKEKAHTNVRAVAADQTVRLTPPKLMSLEQSLEFIGDDECIEVTPDKIRLRKVDLDATTRLRTAKNLKKSREAG
ncbi:MAG: translational GTPase TypA, partial [Acidimicrobiales bacterium]|nr:translational GTPase TypA [Acidimicrobiales bacterium]